MCGVCGGDGSTCKHESGLRMPDKNKVAKRDFVGSKQVMRFPKNSRHVVVTEKGTGQIGAKFFRNVFVSSDFIGRIHY